MRPSRTHSAMRTGLLPFAAADLRHSSAPRSRPCWRSRPPIARRRKLPPASLNRQRRRHRLFRCGWPAQTASGVDPADQTSIDLNGPSARIVDLQRMGGPPQAQLVGAPKPFTFTAAQIGQVFAVALDNAVPPNIYVGASSAYGLPIIVPGQNNTAVRAKKGAPNAVFMPGSWGQAAQAADPDRTGRSMAPAATSACSSTSRSATAEFRSGAGRPRLRSRLQLAVRGRPPDRHDPSLRHERRRARPLRSQR